MALVVTRRIGETLAITNEQTGEELTLILSGKPNRNEVKVVVEAPRHYSVRRPERHGVREAN